MPKTRIHQTVTAPDGQVFEHTALSDYPYTWVTFVKPRHDHLWAPYRWSHSYSAAHHCYLTELRHPAVWEEIALVQVNPETL